jgi:hypothetical protein
LDQNDLSYIRGRRRKILTDVPADDCRRGLAQARIRHTRQRVRLRRERTTGAEAAAVILRHSGRRGEVEEADGFLSDHYDPRAKVLRLS